MQQEKNASTERERIPLECYAWKQISNMICDSSEPFIDVSNFEIKYSEVSSIKLTVLAHFLTPNFTPKIMTHKILTPNTHA